MPTDEAHTDTGRDADREIESRELFDSLLLRAWDAENEEM